MIHLIASYFIERGVSLEDDALPMTRFYREYSLQRVFMKIKLIRVVFSIVDRGQLYTILRLYYTTLTTILLYSECLCNYDYVFVSARKKRFSYNQLVTYDDENVPTEPSAGAESKIVTQYLKEKLAEVKKVCIEVSYLQLTAILPIVTSINGIVRWLVGHRA